LVLEDFLFFSFYSFSWIAMHDTTLKQFWLWSCLDSLEINIGFLFLFSDITFMLPISPTPDPAQYTQTSAIQCIWYWMCIHPSTGCKYCSEPWMLTCWVKSGPSHCWIHICNTCTDELMGHAGCNIHQ
jgi:hypothetical protein